MFEILLRLRYGAAPMALCLIPAGILFGTILRADPVCGTTIPFRGIICQLVNVAGQHQALFLSLALVSAAGVGWFAHRMQALTRELRRP